jgi:stage IV sporulation protein A
MVTTPWYDYEIPMPEAAELGTKKVMEEHCSIGIVVTTDGTVTDIPREDYLEAEERAIRDMAATGKPYLVIINSRDPFGTAAQAVKAQLRARFGVEATTADCQSLDVADIAELLQQLLYAFPMRQLQIYLPRWMDALESEHPVKATLYEALLRQAETIGMLGQAETALQGLRELENILDLSIRGIDLGTGTVSCAISFPDSLFYEILSSKAGTEIENDAQLFALLSDLVKMQSEYNKIADALASVKATGYGIVMPTADEMKLENPEIIRKNGTFGVKLKAGAPSIHMIRVDIDTEISPMVGDEKQSRDLIDHLTGESPENLWQSNIFGKSVYELVQDGLTTKLIRTPNEVREKFRGSLNRIVNEGATGLICLIL